MYSKENPEDLISKSSIDGKMFDSLDLEIMELLLKDGRMSFSDIGKALGVSPSLIQIRFNKLRKTGVILGTSLVLNTEKCGIRSWVNIGVKALETEVDEVAKYMNTLATSNSKVKIFPTFGRFNLAAVIVSRDILQAHKIKQHLKSHPSVIDVSICINLSPFVINFDSLELEKELLPWTK